MAVTDEEEFFAWLDGELDPEAAARIAARVAVDPGLAAQARAHRALGEDLRSAFAPTMSSHVPDRIGSTAINIASAREQRQSRAFGRLPQWTAIAATLVIGIGVGTQVHFLSSNAPVAIEGGRMVAAAGLSKALDRQLASLDQAGSATRIGLTFRNHDGAICRSFGGASGVGLACRDGGAWRIEGLYPAAPAAAGDYRMAAGADPRLAAMIDAVIDGDPLDASAERTAEAKGWR